MELAMWAVGIVITVLIALHIKGIHLMARDAHTEINILKDKMDTKTEALRLEMADKIGDLFNENKKDRDDRQRDCAEDRKQHSDDMREFLKANHDIADAIREDLRKLDLMGKLDVKEYVGTIFNPIKEGLKDDIAEIKVDLSSAVKEITKLIERSNK